VAEALRYRTTGDDPAHSIALAPRARGVQAPASQSSGDPSHGSGFPTSQCDGPNQRAGR
jgi:hypothetical protein